MAPGGGYPWDMEGSGITALVLAIVLAVVYFLPTVVAMSRSHHQWPAIVALNLLLDWTVLGWIAALVWSLTAKRDI